MCDFVRTGRVVFWWGLLTVACLAAQAQAQDLLLCGSYDVRAMRVSGTNFTTLWSWNATNSNLPEYMKGAFVTTDECKPCPGGKVLVTSSGGDSLAGGVALVDPATSNVLFYARGVNAHSAELLPSNRVVVALSYENTGNRIAVYDLATPDVEILTVPLWGAHGLVWDEARQILWGLSDSFIAGYKLTNWNLQPNLVQVSWTGLPDGGGHDMYPVPNSADLMVPTQLHGWLFNRDTRQFTKHPLLGDTPNIKGTSVHPLTGQTVYITADGPYWSEHVRFLTPSNTLDFPGARFYKARWIPTEVTAGVPTQFAIRPTGTNTAQVLWPSSWTNFTLQQSTSLDSTNWGTPLESIDDNGTNKFIIVNPTNQRFYRLLRTAP